MRNQRAHYGCGAALGVAIHAGVPELEMLVVKERRGESGREVERAGEQTGEGAGGDGEL